MAGWSRSCAALEFAEPYRLLLFLRRRMKNKAIAPAMRGTPTPTPTPIPIFEVLLRPPAVESFVTPGVSVADAPEGSDTDVETCGLGVCAAPPVLVLPPFAVLPPPPPFGVVLCVVDAADPVAAVEAALLVVVLDLVVDVVVQSGSPR